MPPPPQALGKIVLQKCTAVTTVRRARQLHALLLTSLTTPSRTPFLDDNILSMYYRCGSIQDAQYLFDKMPHRSIISYNILISAYSYIPEHYDSSFLLFRRLRDKGLFPNECTLLSLLQASVGLESLVLGSLLHGLCVKMGFCGHGRVETSLDWMYSTFGELDFESLMDIDNVAWDTVVGRHVKKGKVAESLRLFSRMLSYGITPTVYAYTSLLNACAKLEDFGSGKTLHAQVVVSGIYIDLPLQNALLAFYCSCSETEAAFKIFSRMLSYGIAPTAFAYTSLLNACTKLETFGSVKTSHAQVVVSGIYIDLPLQNALLDFYCSCSETEAAFKIFSRIREPDLVSWNSMIGGYSENGDGEEAMKLFTQLRRESKLKPDEYSFAAVIMGTAGLQACLYGKPLHAQIVKTGFTKSKYIGSKLISVYSNNNDLLSSQKVFGSFLHKDVILSTAMIAGLVRLGESEAAIIFFHDMFQGCCDINSFMLSSALSACANLKSLRLGETIHSLAIKTGNDTEKCVHASLVDMYAKNGELKSCCLCIFVYS